MIPKIVEEMFVHRGCVERVLHHGSIEDYADPLLGITGAMIPRTREEKLLHLGSEEIVQHRRRIKDYADLFLGIKH